MNNNYKNHQNTLNNNSNDSIRENHQNRCQCNDEREDLKDKVETIHCSPSVRQNREALSYNSSINKEGETAHCPPSVRQNREALSFNSSVNEESETAHCPPSVDKKEEAAKVSRPNEEAAKVSYFNKERIETASLSFSVKEEIETSSLSSLSSLSSCAEKGVRVRFAPSPTGLLHVGSFRTALFNWLFARQNKGVFILRIEDTDRLRSQEKFLESQLADLEWMGLDWDEGPLKGGSYAPYRQMERLPIYQETAEKLLTENKAYRCYCAPEELKERREASKGSGYDGKCRDLTPQEEEKLLQEGRKPCIRFRTPDEGHLKVNDVIKGETLFDYSLQEDFVILKSDGVPAYNFAAAVDDHLMEITHVIRGDEHFSNTPKQVMIYDALGCVPPVFVHIPVILNEDKTKLSKRKGAVNLLDYKERGFLKEALLNFLALLGWAPKDDREIMSKEELLQAFSLEGITKHPAVFDEKKLLWMNSRYIAKREPSDLLEEIKPILEKAGFDLSKKDQDWLHKAVLLYRERVKTLTDFADVFSYYFLPVVEYDPKGAKKFFKGEYLPAALKEIARKIQESHSFIPESLEEILRGYAQELDISAAKLIHPVRLAVTGRTDSPPIFDVLMLLGRETVMERLRQASAYLENQLQPSN